MALKILPPAFADDPDRLRRFQQEAQAAGSLNHPNILAVYDVGHGEGVAYVFTELLEGETLRVRLAGSALSVRKAIEYGNDRSRPRRRPRQRHHPSRHQTGEPIRYQ